MKGCKYLVLLIIGVYIGCVDQKNADYLFEQVTGESIGLDFSNTLVDTDSMNIIQYLYFYNGAGVGVGDVNNDGLPDIFMASNQGKSKLFINESVDGKLKFKDVTEASGIESEGWSTGVNVVDVNGDGKLDLYVCQVNYKSLQGTNRLLINHGIENDLPIYKDETAKYGLSFTGLSTQSAFLDYDLDGDLDMFLLNHSVHSPENYTKSDVRNTPYEGGDQFFKNEEGTFVNVTAESGIYSSKIGFGLGLGISDLNNDGYPDIYVGNDFHENDYLYINNGDGTFRESIETATGHISQFTMGLDIADLNNDGWSDVVTLDMMPEDQVVKKSSVPSESYEIYNFKKDFGYHYQLARNNVQLNTGTISEQVPLFSEVAQLMNMEDTDWSWSSILSDFNCDGHRDLFVTNGIVRRPNDLDYLNYISNNLVQEKAADAELIKNMPSGAVSNYLFLNEQNLQMKNASSAILNNEPGFSTGAASADFDGDGDLDVVINNINNNASILINLSNPVDYVRVALEGNDQNRQGIGAKITSFAGEHEYHTQVRTTRGFMSSSSDAVLLYKLDNQHIDSIEIQWPSGAKETILKEKLNQRVSFKESNAITAETYSLAIHEPLMFVPDTLLDFIHSENGFSDITSDKLMPWLLSTQGPALAVEDVNNDGLDDVYIGGSRGSAAGLFLQTQMGNFERSSSNLFESQAHFEDVAAIFLDVDGDDDLDLFVASGGNEYSNDSPFLLDRIYLNDGAGNFEKSSRLIPLLTENSSSVDASDFDNDGDVDLIVGSISKTRSYGFSAGAFLLQNDGSGKFKDITKSVAPGLVNVGMVTDVAWDDIDEDGDQDIVIVGEWMPITLMINNGATFSKSEVESSTGLWRDILLHDIDGDGQNDLILGNYGTNTFLAQNEKAGMTWGDFDNNSVPEPLFYLRDNGQRQPVASRDLLVSQMNIFKSLHKDYSSFAKADFTSMFGPVIGKGVFDKQLDELESCWYKNLSGTSYRKMSLPIEAQFAPTFATSVIDINGDNIDDLVLGGNLYEVSPNIGRADASKGLILLGTEESSFIYDEKYNTKFSIKGQIRNMRQIKVSNANNLLIARNNDTPIFFKL